MADKNTTQKIIIAGTTMAIATPALQYMHTGGVGILVGLFSGVIAWNVMKDIVPEDDEQSAAPQPRKEVRDSLAYRLTVGKSMRGNAADHQHGAEHGNGDDFEQIQTRTSIFTFSDLLATGWRPSPESIFLARLEDGSNVYVTLEQIVHIALAGSTRQGKTSIIRQLLVQFCSIDTTCFLLDPHYTPYDIETGEDWTPFLPKLRFDPIECKSYDRIEQVLRHAATTLLDKRKSLRAQSQPVGKHTFFVIDEYPAIVAEKPEVAQHIGKLLREGGKYKLHIVIASQDFQVKTIDPDSKTGGAIRDNFNVCLYVGGDSTTANKLLDVIVPREVEAQLGKGPIYLKSPTHKKASLAYTPWCDNEAIYNQIGPSTYHPEESSTLEDELSDDFEDDIDNDENDNPTLPDTEALHDTTNNITPIIPDTGRKAEEIDLNAAIAVYNTGATSRYQLAKVFGLSESQGRKLKELIEAKAKVANG